MRKADEIMVPGLGQANKYRIKLISRIPTINLFISRCQTIVNIQRYTLICLKTRNNTCIVYSKLETTHALCTVN